MDLPVTTSPPFLPQSPGQQHHHQHHHHHSPFSRRLVVPMFRSNIRNTFSSSPRQTMTMSPRSSPRGSPGAAGSPRQRYRLYDGEDDVTTTVSLARARARAQKENESMIYLDGPQVYACAHCRTHLTSHDDIISKSFHGRHGRAYLFDHCVNVTTGPPEDRLLITGLHSVCDIFCKRCKKMVGWTYSKAYEPSQKYKEGKFIIEKINLHIEESFYDVSHPAGERQDRWRKRSMSWGNGEHSCDLVYEYKPTKEESQRSLMVDDTGSENFGSPARGVLGIAAIDSSLPSPPFL